MNNNFYWINAEKYKYHTNSNIIYSIQSSPNFCWTHKEMKNKVKELKSLGFQKIEVTTYKKKSVKEMGSLQEDK